MSGIFPKMLEGLGAKQVAHRLLSSAPFFALALAAVFAEPSGQGNRDVFWAANSFFQQPRNSAMGVAIITAYFALWWWTSLPGSPPRQKLQMRLRGFQSNFLSCRATLFNSADDSAFEDATSKANELLNEMKAWIESNMSQEAWLRVSRSKELDLIYAFNGERFSAEKAQARNGVINGLDGYVEGLDQLIKHGGWDK